MCSEIHIWEIFFEHNMIHHYLFGFQMGEWEVCIYFSLFISNLLLICNHLSMLCYLDYLCNVFAGSMHLYSWICLCITLMYPIFFSSLIRPPQISSVSHIPLTFVSCEFTANKFLMILAFLLQVPPSFFINTYT